MKLPAKLEKHIKELQSYFNISADLVPQEQAEAEIRSGISFKGSQLSVLIFAIFIASVGLNTNSIPVIIGAMLISPLMGPILGIGLSIGIADYDLLKRSIKNIGMAITGSILASALYFLISPIYEGSNQLLARTSPSLYDVFVGLFGGAAGIISICCKNKGNVMAGVAIATSLMPPLCTVGYGLATLQSQYFFGALYLFFINMIFILFATWIGVKLMGYKSNETGTDLKSRRIKNIVYTIVTGTVLLSIYLTTEMIKNNNFLKAADNFVETEMVFPNTQVLSHEQYIEKGKRHIDVTLIGDPLPIDSLQLAMLTKLDSVGLGGTILNIRQGFSTAKNDIDQKETFHQFYTLMQSQITQQQHLIDSLNLSIADNNRISNSITEITPEIKVLFPNIDKLAFSPTIKYNVSTDSLNKSLADTTYIIFVDAKRGLNPTDRKRLEEYISLRLKKSNTDLIINPNNFPWK